MSHHVWCERQTQNKFLSRPHPSSWWQKGEFLIFWTLFVVEEDIVSLTSFIAAAFLSFAFFTPYNLFHVVLSWCALLSCWWWSCWTQVFWTPFWEWFTNFLMAKLPLSPFLASFTKKRPNKHPTCLQAILFLSCSQLLVVILVKVTPHHSHNSNSRAQTRALLKQHLCPVNTSKPAGMGLHQLEDFQWAQ